MRSHQEIKKPDRLRDGLRQREISRNTSATKDDNFAHPAPHRGPTKTRTIHGADAGGLRTLAAATATKEQATKELPERAAEVHTQNSMRTARAISTKMRSDELQYSTHTAKDGQVEVHKRGL